MLMKGLNSNAERAENMEAPSRMCDTKTEIFNSKTGKCVKKSGAVGKAILARYQELDDRAERRYRASNPKNADVEYTVQYTLHTSSKSRIPTKKELQYLIQHDVRPAFLDDPHFEIVDIQRDGVVVYRVGGRSDFESGNHLFDSPDDDGNLPIGKYLFYAEVLGKQRTQAKSESKRGRRGGKDEEDEDVITACPSDKILNPETMRCVSRTGAIGKRILAAQSQPQKTHKKVPVTKKAKVVVVEPDSDTDEGCVRQVTSKYVNRNGPPFEGNAVECRNTYKTGNDGALYQSRGNVNGVFSWRKTGK